MAARYQPTEISTKIQELAKRAPLAKWWLPQIPEGEPLSVPSGIEALGPMAMTLNEAVSPLIKLIKPGLSEVAKQEIADSIRLILKGVPRKLIQRTKKFSIYPEGREYLASSGMSRPTSFGEHKGVSGVIWNKVKDALEFSPEIKVTPEVNPTGAYAYSFPETIAHEYGHGAHQELAHKIGGEEGVNKLFFDILEKESIAESLGKSMSAKANVPFGHKRWAVPGQMGMTEEAPFKTLAKALKKKWIGNIKR